MFTHTKSKTLTEVNCSPGASTEVVKKDKKATVRPRTTRLASGRSRKSRKEEAQPDAATTCDRREEQDQAAPYLPGAQSAVQAP